MFRTNPSNCRLLRSDENQKSLQTGGVSEHRHHRTPENVIVQPNSVRRAQWPLCSDLFQLVTACPTQSMPGLVKGKLEWSANCFNCWVPVCLTLRPRLKRGGPMTPRQSTPGECGPGAQPDGAVRNFVKFLASNCRGDPGAQSTASERIALCCSCGLLDRRSANVASVFGAHGVPLNSACARHLTSSDRLWTACPHRASPLTASTDEQWSCTMGTLDHSVHFPRPKSSALLANSSQLSR